jgi:hypothetical protein
MQIILVKNDLVAALRRAEIFCRQRELSRNFAKRRRDWERERQN